jgi:hypothetical protein
MWVSSSTLNILFKFVFKKTVTVANKPKEDNDFEAKPPFYYHRQRDGRSK